MSWHCSDPEGGPDVGVSLVIAPGVNLWCGEIPNERLAEASDDVRAFADAAFGWWLVIYTHDSATVVGRVGAEEGRALLEYRLSPALRAASAIEAAAAGETRSGSTEGESAVGKAETPTPSGETPHG